MKIINANIIEKIVTGLIVVLVMFSTGTLFYFLSMRLGQTSIENQAYNRYNACVLSIPDLERDKEAIDYCWNEAQKDTGVEVKRYYGQ